MKWLIRNVYWYFSRCFLVGFFLIFHFYSSMPLAAVKGMVAATPLVTSSSSQVIAGTYHTCTINQAGGVECWGMNTQGQLGVGNNTNSNLPVDVTGLSSGVSAIAAGDEHTCAALSSGGGKCWGRNSSGQLGNGSTANSNVPVSVNSLSEILIGIDAGNEHTCGLTNKGSMVCWGQNNSGQLGDGTYQDKTSPVAVTGISSGATSLATGGSHSCGVVNGTLKCWWDNQYGQLGDGTGNSSYLPVNVFGLVNGVNTISAGGSHSCAVIIPSEVKCWGSSDDGEIGNGIPIQRLTPVLVTGYEGAQTMFIPMVIQGHQGN